MDKSINERMKTAQLQKEMQEHDVTDKDYLFNGANLSGAGLFDKDLQVALATGRDLDGVDIPDDTPEERNSKNIKHNRDIER